MAQGTGLQGSWGSAVTTVRTAAQGPEYEVGSLRLEGGNWYKYVKYASSGPIACVAGTMTGYYTMDGHKLHTVTLDTTDMPQAATLLAAGIAQGVIPELGFGWILIKGFATMSVAFIAGTDGDPCTLVGATADTGDLDLYISGDLSHICGWIQDESDNELVVDCPW